jgi:hypothetical protein
VLHESGTYVRLTEAGEAPRESTEPHALREGPGD